jgi:hypothetical protein
VVDELNWGKIPRAWTIVEAMVTGSARLRATPEARCEAEEACCAASA